MSKANRLSPILLRARVAGLAVLLGLLIVCGGQNPVSTPLTTVPTTTTTLPPPTTLADLSAKATSPDAEHYLNCREDVHAHVTLTNRSGNAVTVTGVAKTSNGLSGGCNAAPDFTYDLGSFVVEGHSTQTVMDRALYRSGSGCCSDPSQCTGQDTCGVQENFTVVTNIGNVHAGSFKYKVNFDRCPKCSSATASGRSGCPPPSH